MSFAFAAVGAALDSLPVAVTRIAVLFLGVKVVQALYNVASFFAVYLRPSQIHRYVYNDAQGRPPWALVTGASDGVGTGLADELAAIGLNVVLHGRNTAKLEGVRQALEAKYPQGQFRLLVIDASKTPGPELDNLVETTLGDIHLTMLINNAGGGLMHPTYGALAEVSTQRIVENVTLNGVFPLVLTARVLELFHKTPATGPSLIMNIGSLGDIGMPFVATYASAKVMMLAATTMARRELAALGQASTQMLAVRFGVVTGVSHTRTPPTWSEPDARTMARVALARTGSGRDSVIAHLPQALPSAVLGLLTATQTDRLLEQVMTKRRNQELEEMARQKKAS
ncbi:hypothetical protein SCUCBS95973_008145 [Sporothrix curviconia]|uniref:Uncharacterized protein n=1 Tax=Sporothrix curviconia TaxID=1260050 RepID=A0ABP0CJ15_9PEZI